VKKNISFHRILIAKTTHLGDLVISLPMAGMIKQRYPESTVLFLTHPGAVDVAKRCLDVDEVHTLPETSEQLITLLKSLNVDVFIQVNTSKQLGLAAKSAEIPLRIGTLYRYYNWRLCTHTVAISRSYKHLNKRLLDLEYLKPLGISVDDEKLLPMLYRFSKKNANDLVKKMGLDFAKHRIILHPALITAKAHQWPLTAYSTLIHSFDRNRFQWVITGTVADRAYLEPLLSIDGSQADVVDTVGHLTLDELITFMTACDGLIAGSTGPLHLAAALGLHTLGLYQSKLAINKRWAPIGRSATTLYSSTRCQGDKRLTSCPCILDIDPQSVKTQIMSWFDNES